MPTKFEIPHDGPCKDHPCDNCRICQRGRCCRNDNPHYRLPAEGAWAGRIYGEVGELRDDGAKVQCHACGAYYHQLGFHIRVAHDLTAEEYRSIFGLKASRPLAGPILREKFREIEARLQRLAPYVDPTGGALGRLTPEQRSAQSLGKKRRREALASVNAAIKSKWDDPKWAEAQRKRLSESQQGAPRPANAARHEASLETRVCSICGEEFLIQHSRRNKLCGKPTCRKVARGRLWEGEKSPSKRPEGRATASARAKERVGEKNSAAKLTTDQVLEIRWLYDAGTTGVIEIGRQFGIGSGQVCAIGKRQSWAHVPEGPAPTRVCENEDCGKEFTPSSRRNAYCGIDCRRVKGQRRRRLIGGRDAKKPPAP